MDVNLVYFKPTGEKKSIRIDKDTTLVGRGPDCDLRIPIDMCSRQHFQLEIHEAGVIIRDLGSANGTFVNNERVNEVTLSAGDKITLGPIVFTVQIDGMPRMIAPPDVSSAPAASARTYDTIAPSSIPTATFDVDDDDEDEDDPLGSLQLADVEDDAEDPLAALEALADSQEDEDNPLG